MNDPDKQLARIRIAGFDRGESLLMEIEPQIGFSRGLIGSVTLETFVRKNGADVTIEIDLPAPARQAREAKPRAKKMLKR